ncbi:Shr3 amino acid permease chaperone [Flagelloscypha sp. PMI_526]|nr:Shr3 amino acid permease chaperone [Flagelloscypha sp. PMI_526]
MLRSLLTICVTSFLLGFVFTHWIADSLTLWKSPVTDEHLWTAAAYYSILANGPIIFLYFQSAVIALGLATFFSSIFDGQAVNLMFDGGSIFLFMGSILLYVYSVLPVVFSKFASLPSHQLKDPFPWTLRADTIDLAANNLYCSVALTGVLVLQAGRFWTESAEAEDFDLINDTDLVRFSRAKSPELSS